MAARRCDGNTWVTERRYSWKEFSANRCWRPCYGRCCRLRFRNHMSSLEGKGNSVNGLMSVGWRAFDCCVWQAWSDVNHPSPRTWSGAGDSPLPRGGEGVYETGSGERLGVPHHRSVGQRLETEDIAAGVHVQFAGIGRQAGHGDHGACQRVDESSPY